jgi:hypothetical protein
MMMTCFKVLVLPRFIPSFLSVQVPPFSTFVIRLRASFLLYCLLPILSSSLHYIATTTAAAAIIVFFFPTTYDTA